MYCPDTLNRINEVAVAAYMDDDDKGTCDFCSEPADEVRPVYNPRDKVEGRDGAYAMMNICENCRDNGYDMEEHFYCPHCGEFFIVNHSWDVVAVMDPEWGYTCQSCYAEHMEGVPLGQLLENLVSSDPCEQNWPRINEVPGKAVLWAGEYSGYSDFPGHTSLGSIHDEIWEAAEEEGLSRDATVYPVVAHGYQFSVALAVYFEG